VSGKVLKVLGQKPILNYDSGITAKDRTMTSDAQRAAIRQMIETHTKTVTVDKQTARDSLIKEGFYTKDGKLTEQYGGGSKKSA
jgi:hypothetical protein